MRNNIFEILKQFSDLTDEELDFFVEYIVRKQKIYNTEEKRKE